MSSRVVPEFDGTPTLTPEKVETFKAWLASAMGDEDKAGTVVDAAFYEGWAEAMKAVLRLLHYGTEENSGD